MATAKEDAIQLITTLPDDCTMEEIQYHLYVREKVEQGLRDVREGKTLSQEQVEQRIEKWQKSSGPDRP